MTPAELNQSIFDSLISKYNRPTMSPAEVAAETGISASHVRRMCASHTITAGRIGDRWVIPTVELAAILSGTKNTANPSIV